MVGLTRPKSPESLVVTADFPLAVAVAQDEALVNVGHSSVFIFYGAALSTVVHTDANGLSGRGGGVIGCEVLFTGILPFLELPRCRRRFRTAATASQSGEPSCTIGSWFPTLPWDSPLTKRHDIRGSCGTSGPWLHKSL